MHFNGQTFSSVFEQFSFNSKLFWLKMQKYTFLRKMVLIIVFFIKLAFRWLQTGLSALKNTNQLKILLMVDFLRIFIMLHFSKFFEIFEIHHYFLVRFT